MHLSPQAIRWTQDDEFVEKMLAPNPLGTKTIVALVVAALLLVGGLAFLAADGMKAERGQGAVLLRNDLNYCYFWNGAKLQLSQSPSSTCRAHD